MIVGQEEMIVRIRRWVHSDECEDEYWTVPRRLVSQLTSPCDQSTEELRTLFAKYGGCELTASVTLETREF